MSIEQCRCLWCQKGDVGAHADVLAVIERCGHAVIPIIGSHPQNTFTIGLVHTYRHPELIIFGVAPEEAQKILNNCAALIKRDGPLKLGEPYNHLANMPTIFRTANPNKAKPYIGRAVEFNSGAVPPVVQVVWPDPAGHFPWQPGYDRRFERMQPRLWGSSTSHSGPLRLGSAPGRGRRPHRDRTH